MIRVGAFRYFLAVAPVPGWNLLAFAAAVVVGAATLLQDPREIDSALALVLLMQMFAASGGFTGVAARGHFDPLLVSPAPRVRIALGNLASSTLPGVVGWFVVVAIAAMAGGAERAFSLHRHAALLVVSSVAWMAGIVLPRNAPGVLWCGALLAFALARGTLSDQLVLMQTLPSTAADLLVVSAACVICPFLLLGDFPAPRNPLVLVAVSSAALAAIAAGIRIIAQREYVLTETA
jgi:hypothetical protein